MAFFRLAQHSAVHFTDIVSGGKIEYVIAHMPNCCMLASPLPYKY